MKSIDLLEKTTFSGRRFTRKQLASVQEMAEMYSNLSRKELAQTLCEHLNWKTANGRNKINSCLTLLEKLEEGGFLTLPAKRETKAPVRRTPTFKEPPKTEVIKASLASIGPLKLQRVITKEDREDWKAFIQTYHYLGYKQPVGSHLGYFIVSERTQQKLGCLLFSASAAWALAPRDQWIGWEKKHRVKQLRLILSNDRFLIFPWVHIPNLASHALSMALKQIGDDWEETQHYRPVLVETFVDQTKFTGACYKASNWVHVGQTQGRGHFDPKHECSKTKKDIYMFPLQSNWRECLTTLSSKATKPSRKPSKEASLTANDRVITLWQEVVEIFHQVALEYDSKWQTRRRVIDSAMLMLLIFRLVSSKNAQSYRTTIDDLWHSCNTLKLKWNQGKKVAASSFCNARKKLDETIFKCLNKRILEAYPEEVEAQSWLGHRVFAVDGSLLNLPRALFEDGYTAPSKRSYHPQGLLSCLYQVHSQLPIDFCLASHRDERACAIGHLNALKKDDVVVYDRGYYSYMMLHRHYQTGIHAIFRLQSSSSTAIREFFEGSETEIITSIYPSEKARRDIRKKHPNFEFIPLKIRLLKYEVAGSIFHLGTTLVEPHQDYPIKAYMDVYHSRWGVEELYKVSKQIIDVEDFHAKSERGVKQEIFAHFALITMNRLFANQADHYHNSPEGSLKGAQIGSPLEGKAKTNFKNCIHALTRDLEALFLVKHELNKTVNRVFNAVLDQSQKVRPGRSYERKSMRPRDKWRPQSKARRKSVRAP